MILSTLSISFHGFALGFPERPHTNGDVFLVYKLMIALVFLRSCPFFVAFCLGEGICIRNLYLFQNPGEIEEEMAVVGAKEVVRGILTTRKTGPPIFPKGQAFQVRPGSSTPLPSWLSEEDLSYFASKFESKGFTGPLNYYRSMDL